MLLGQVSTGGIVSGLTVTVKQHALTTPLNTLVQQTVVVPGGKKLPDGGVQMTGSTPPVQTLVA